ERARLATLERELEREEADYRRCDDDTERAVIRRLLARIDADREGQARAVEAAEARLAEGTAAPDIDAALDFYSDLVERIRSRIGAAAPAVEVNATLRDVLAGVAMKLDAKNRLYATFRLRHDAEPLSRGVLPEFGFNRFPLADADAVGEL